VLKYKLRCYLSAKETESAENSARETIDQSEFEDASDHDDKKDHASVASSVVPQPVSQQPSTVTPVTEPVKPAPVTPLATNKVQPVTEASKGQLSPRAKYKLEIEKQRLEIDRLKADLDKYRNTESGRKCL
jgi:cell division septation protein DedD